MVKMNYIFKITNFNLDIFMVNSFDFGLILFDSSFDSSRHILQIFVLFSFRELKKNLIAFKEE